MPLTLLLCRGPELLMDRSQRTRHVNVLSTARTLAVSIVTWYPDRYRLEKRVT